MGARRLHHQTPGPNLWHLLCAGRAMPWQRQRWAVTAGARAAAQIPHPKHDRSHPSAWYAIIHPTDQDGIDAPDQPGGVTRCSTWPRPSGTAWATIRSRAT